MDFSRIRILVFDPNRELTNAVVEPLRAEGFQVECVRTIASALNAAGKEAHNLVIKPFVSERAESRSGLMESMRSACPDTQFIFVSSSATVESAMLAIHRGAFDYLALPCETDRLVKSVRSALQRQKIVAENPEILERLHYRNDPNILTGGSRALKRIKEVVDRIAATDVTVLIQGESGTGKEVVARMLHQQSHRREGPFVAVNCAALADSIIESELFGHVRGAFTGAVADKPGRFDLARGGTLFLDEIGDLSPLGQADLLRVLEDGIFRPVGSRNTVRSDVRIIAATNRDLEDRCLKSMFREDLLYRLNVIAISIPALRERPEDVADLVQLFSRHFCHKHNRPLKNIAPDLMDAFSKLSWPGNVRQLRNTIEQMVLLVPSQTLKEEHLPRHLDKEESQPITALRYGMKLAEVEKRLIRLTLDSCKGNRSEAARQLGISRRSMHYRLAQILKSEA